MINSLVRRGRAKVRKEGVRKGDRKNGVPSGKRGGEKRKTQAAGFSELRY